MRVDPSMSSLWTLERHYRPGETVWWQGAEWRCQVEHTSGAGAGGGGAVGAQPGINHSVWSQLPQPSWGYSVDPPAYPGPSQSQRHLTHASPPILSPTPMPWPSKPPSPSYYAPNEKEKQAYPGGGDDYEDEKRPPSDTETVTDENEKKAIPVQVRDASRLGWGGGRWDMDFFTDRVSDTMRFLTMKDEGRKGRESGEWTSELKGKRVWKTGGIGIWSYSLEEAEESKKKKVWEEWAQSHPNGAKDEWLKAAKERTAFYNRDTRGPKPLIMWKLVERGGPLPYDALPIGHESNGTVLYAARTYFEKGVHLGKASPYIVNGVSISYGGVEHNPDIFEVLCGPSDPTLLKWMTFRHGERAEVEGWQPVEGGREANGHALLIAKGEYENGEHPGKCLVGDDHACMGWAGGEVWVRPFQVLAYSTTSRR